MDFIVKHHVFGGTRCPMYSIEWQKRGLPHAHILIWLLNKIRPAEIDQIISAEIPDRTIDPELIQSYPNCIRATGRKIAWKLFEYALLDPDEHCTLI